MGLVGARGRGLVRAWRSPWILMALPMLMALACSGLGQTGSGEVVDPTAEEPPLSAEKEKIADRICNELVSPCCWTTTVAVHGSGAAPRIQAEVRQMLSRGLTYQEILDHYVAEYGERILAKPKRTGFNLAAYWGPYLGILLAALISILSIRRSMRRRRETTATVPPAPVPDEKPHPTPGSDEEYRRRIENELRRSS